MNILYIDFVLENEIGVKKKIKSQKKALRYLGAEVMEAQIKENFFCLNDKKIFKRRISKNLIFQKIFNKRMIYKSLKKLECEDIYSEVDIVYFRYISFSPWLIGYFKFLKNKNIRIVLEIPTYPYEGEGESKFEKIFKWDKKYREKAKKYVDKIVTYSEDSKIWGIDCINISNGIDLEEIINYENSVQEDKIIFLSVSNLSYWHGIDRFLKAMQNYLKQEKKEKIFFYIVGSGNEEYKLKKYVNNNKELIKNVAFLGVKTGQELDKIYEKANIAVGSLGRFRSGVTTMKALKNREYAAKGKPMIYSETDLDLDNKRFVYKVSHDEKDIDINEIVKWYKKLDVKSNEIQNIAKNFSWILQMKKILDNLD